MNNYKNDYFKTLLLVCLTASGSITMSGQTIFKNATNQIPQSNTTGTDTVDSDLVDVDGDGDLDIFIAEGTAGISGRSNRLLLNDGSGNFTDVSSSNLPISPRPANSLSADFADFDNDGDIDIVVANLGPTQLLINNGQGVFMDGSRTLLPPPPMNIFEDISTEIGFEDVNSDGRLDIFVTNEIPPIPDIGPGGSQNFLYIQKEDGTFGDESLLRLPNVKNQSASFAFGDIDKDGDNDLIIANVGQNQVLINNGSGFFTNDTSSRIAQQKSTSRAVVLADIDSDRDLDLIVANSNQEQNQVFINDSEGFFQENTSNSFPIKNDTSSDVKLFDFNYDGSPDIIFANSVPNPLGPAGGGHPLAPAPNIILVNDGKGIFSDVSTVFLPGDNAISFDIEIEDVNGDRLEDILVSNANDGIEELYIRDITPPTRFRRIKPFTFCVTENNNGTFTATFGYANFNRTPVYIPEGSRNRIFPDRIDRVSDQPVVFLPGIVREAFTATFDRRILWKVNRRRAYASRWTRRCDVYYGGDHRTIDETPITVFNSTNYPNPFSGTTTIQYTLPQPSPITIKIHNQSGILIKTIHKPVTRMGVHKLEVNMSNLGLQPGVYFYQIRSETDKITKSFVIK